MNDGRTEAYLFSFDNMLFNKDDKIANERILYETRPSLIFGCKKAIIALILLIIVLMYSPKIIESIGNMQVYLIKYVKVSFARYFSIAILVVIFIIIFYIIIKLLTWYSTEYTLTDMRIIQKKGLLYTRKNYMHYNAIQDINSSQSLFGKIFDVATISTYSAYDNNSMDLKSIGNAKKVEEIIFNQMNQAKYGGFYGQPQYQDPYYQEPVTPNHQRPYHEHVSNYQSSQRFYDNSYSRDVEPNSNYYEPPKDYYDEYGDPEGVITPNHNLNKKNMDNLDKFSNNSEYKVSNDYSEHVSQKPYHEKVGDYFIELEDNKSNKSYKKIQENTKEKKKDLSREKIIENHFDKFKL